MVLRAIALYVGLFVAEAGIIGWFFFHDFHQRATDEQMAQARQVARELARKLENELGDGSINYLRVTELRQAWLKMIDDETASARLVTVVQIQTPDGKPIARFVRDQQGTMHTVDDTDRLSTVPVSPDSMPRIPGPREPGVLRVVDPPRTVLVPVAAGVAELILGIDPQGLEVEVAEVRRRLIWKLAIVGLASLLLLGIGFSYTFSLLRRTRKLAVDSQRAEQLAQMGTLASGLAHEIRNPLNAMNINLELLEEDLARGAVGPESLEMLRASRSEVQRLEQLVRDFLAFARPRTSIREEIVPGELVADVVRFIRPEFAKAGVELELKHEAEAPTVRVDTGQIRQALLNILSNALDASRQGNRVEVVVAPTVQGDARISIRDEGEGISADDRAHIFEIFWSKKLKTPGSGLGLPIAQRAVQEHGGRIEVDSSSGAGSTFSIVLPPAAVTRERTPLGAPGGR